MYDQSQNNNIVINASRNHPWTFKYPIMDNLNEDESYQSYQETMNNTNACCRVNHQPDCNQPKISKRKRISYTFEQLSTLEKEFFETKKIDRKRRTELANSLQMTQQQVKIWFQNKRAKEKKTISCDNVEPITLDPFIDTSSSSNLSVCDFSNLPVQNIYTADMNFVNSQIRETPFSNSQEDVNSYECGDYLYHNNYNYNSVTATPISYGQNDVNFYENSFTESDFSNVPVQNFPTADMNFVNSQITETPIADSQEDVNSYEHCGDYFYDNNYNYNQSIAYSNNHCSQNNFQSMNQFDSYNFFNQYDNPMPTYNENQFISYTPRNEQLNNYEALP